MEQSCLEIGCNINRAENNEQVQVFVWNRNKRCDPWFVWIHTVAEDAIPGSSSAENEKFVVLKSLVRLQTSQDFLSSTGFTQNVHAALFHRLEGLEGFKLLNRQIAL